MTMQSPNFSNEFMPMQHRNSYDAQGSCDRCLHLLQAFYNDKIIVGVFEFL